jgi:hypothetical protein
VGANVLGVPHQLGRAVDVAPLRRGEERVERDLCVDHDLLAAGQPHHDVWAQQAVVGPL